MAAPDVTRGVCVWGAAYNTWGSPGQGFRKCGGSVTVYLPRDAPAWPPWPLPTLPPPPVSLPPLWWIYLLTSFSSQPPHVNSLFSFCYPSSLINYSYSSPSLSLSLLPQWWIYLITSFSTLLPHGNCSFCLSISHHFYITSVSPHLYLFSPLPLW